MKMKKNPTPFPNPSISTLNRHSSTQALICMHVRDDTDLNTIASHTERWEQRHHFPEPVKETM